MEADKELICRLCFKRCYCGFEVIDDTIQEIFHMLFIGLDLTVTDQPIVCYTCLDSLMKCFDTKAGYVQRNDENVVDKIKNEYMTTTVIISGSSNTCCLCRESIKCKVPVISLNQVENIVLMLEKHFEVVLNTTEETAICMVCYESLQQHFIFINSCLTVEKDIRDFCEIRGTNSTGQIELTEVISFMVDNINGINNGSWSPVEVVENKYSVISDEDLTETKDCQLNITFGESQVKSEEKCYSRSEGGIQQDTKIETTSSPARAVYKCHICAFQCNYKYGLHLHILRHNVTPEQLYRCEFCTYCTDLKTSLQIHILTHKSASDVTMYKCDKCPLQVRYKSSLRRHRLTHDSIADVTMYKCKLCTFQAAYSNGLRNHMLTHQSTSELTMFKCDTCPFQTKRKGSLQRHMLMHKDLSNVMLHKCELCNFETKHKYNLTKHMMVHKSSLEIPMYKCEVCTFETKYKKDLSAHVLKHKSKSEVTMYKCEMCSYETKHKRDVSRHLIRKHSIRAQAKGKCEDGASGSLMNTTKFEVDGVR